jgi:hypothetical protein
MSIRLLVEIKGPRSETLVKGAKEALLRANPHLRDLKKTPEGALIVVPEVSDAKLTEEVRSVGFPAGEMLKHLHQALSQAHAAIDASTTRTAEEVRDTLDLMKSRKFKVLARKIPAVKECIPKINAESKARLKRVTAQKAFQEKGLAQLHKDLADLVNRLT